MMHEKAIFLDTPDGKQIFCIANQAGVAPSARVVVLSHGLTGGPNEYMHQAARDFFMARGYDVLRFAYYWIEPQCRKLEETTLAIHAQDLQTVLAHARQQYAEIFVCGHSYGGLTLLFANPDVTALSFWDSAYRPGWVSSSDMIDGKTYVKFGGKHTLMGQEMVAEAQRLLESPEELTAMAKAIQAPSQIVVAGDGDKQDTLNDLLNALTCEKEMHVVADADHSFYHRATVQELLVHTDSWFTRHSATQLKRMAS